jgi:methanethiol S-methyltransferase
MFISVGLIRFAGILAAAAGLVLMLVCIRKYFFSLSGLRGLFIESATNELIITGVHKFMRHPLYLGTFAFIWGFFIVYPYLSLFISNTVITVYTLIGIHLEEQKLVAEFGDQYRQYRQRVPKLIPRFRSRRDFG